MNNKAQKLNNKSRGFVLFVALLTSSFLLAVGLGVSSLAIRGFQLTSNTTESIKALYAANAGIECALYWDLKSGIDPFKLIDSATDYIQFPFNTLSCSQDANNEDPNGPSFGLAPDYVGGTQTATVGFWLSFRAGDRNDLSANGPCVYVTINKTFVGASANNQIRTVVDAYGYNLHGVSAGSDLTCIPGNINSSPSSRVERFLRAIY